MPTDEGWEGHVGNEASQTQVNVDATLPPVHAADYNRTHFAIPIECMKVTADTTQPANIDAGDALPHVPDCLTSQEILTC